jgi:hypothetical protein
MTKPVPQLFSPPPLKRSVDSKTPVLILYSTNTSSMLGKGSKMEVYFQPSELPRPLPGFVDWMIYTGGSPDETAKSRVYAFGLNRDKQHDSVYRYDELRTGGHSRIGSVYLPKLTFSDAPPETCWLEVTLPAGA